MSLTASPGLRPNPWRAFAGEMIVPVLLSAYATHYYLSVGQLSKPETNLLLIGPVYWILIVCSLIFAASRLRDTLRVLRHAKSGETGEPAEGQESPRILDPLKSIAFVTLTAACVWLIPILGFATTIAAYTLLLLLALGVRSLAILLLTPTLLTGLLWVGMEMFLNLRLPVGLLL